MGACASKFKELKATSDAPPPAPKEEEAFRELNLVEEIVKKEDAPAVAADNEVKHQSLGHLFKEGEVEKGSADNNGKAFEEVKQDDTKPQGNENKVSPKPVTDTPAKDETEKPTAIDDGDSKTSEEKKAEHEKSASQNVEAEGIADKICCMDKKPDTPDAEKKNTEENLAEVTKLETSETKKIEQQKPASDAEEKKKEEKPTEASTIEASEKVEDKQVVELLETEKSITDEKPDNTEAKEQNPALDVGGPKAGEEKTELLKDFFAEN